MRPICFFRWQLFTFSKAFHNITLATTPPLSPPPLQRPVVASQPPSADNRDKKRDNSKSLQTYDLKLQSQDSVQRLIRFFFSFYR